jgi:hypothetical protein
LFGLVEVALSLAEAAYFRSRRPAPICFIKGSTEVDALRSSVQAPLREVWVFTRYTQPEKDHRLLVAP